MSEVTPSSGRYPPKSRVRRTAPVAVTLVKSVSGTITIAGFPLSTWAFALRIWAAMMVALYAAFWLQLESASSAAVTVAILARPTRGQAYQKAVYRVLATIIGVVASFVIAGLFPQSRSLFLIGFAGWLGLCVYVGGLLDGNRAYSGILSGYTVALVAVTQIDSPQNIFSAGVNRGAAIVVGIAAIALISDVFAAPNVHAGLSGKLIAAHRRVRAFALAILCAETADPIQSAKLLREITALHPDITALAAESSSGSARAAAARSAAVALVADQVKVELPILQERFRANPNQLMQEMGVAPGPRSVAALKNRLLGSIEPFSTFGLPNSLAGFLVGPLVLALAVAALATVLLSMTTFARKLYGVGTNRAAARLAGVNVKRVLVVPYVVSGAGAAVTGVLLLGYLGQAFITMGDVYLFSSAVAVAVGGASILGGKGHYIGTVAGAIILTLITANLNLISLGTSAIDVAYGVILLGTVYLATMRMRNGQSPRFVAMLGDVRMSIAKRWR